MLAFRSEAHADRYLESRRLPRGATFSLHQLWGLADAWYANRLAADWRRRTPEESEALFASLGLTGDFWRLKAAAQQG